MGAIAGEELKKMDKMQTLTAREEKILVLVRLRPLNEKEIEANEVADWECINDTTVLYRNTLREGSTFPSAYTFDRVYRGDCTTRQVYEEGTKEIALSVVEGINSSIFAYGQTSSGKTYTMTGITEFAVADIFDYIYKHEERAFVVKFSAIEIYNEAIRDLLSNDNTSLRLRDDPEKGTIVEKATEEILRDWSHLKDLLSICEAQRKIGETSLNERSSRSHQIIRLTVESSAREFLGKENSTTLAASVNFIDLAGSERASQAMSAGTRLKEGCHINRSLLTLGTVIRKLSKGRQGHINYRDSKLTRILQPCLGGNARTAIVCTLSPSRSHVEQTRNTLLFACCAKEVTTKAQINVVMSDKALVKHLQRELARLESELRNPNPNPVASNCSCAVALRKKDLQIQKMEKEIEDLIKQRDLAQSRLDDFMKMVGNEESLKVLSVARPFESRVDNKWGDGSVSEISGVVDPDRISFISDGTSTPISTARDQIQSHSDDLYDEVSPEEYCKEVQCIEIEEQVTDLSHDSNANANGWSGREDQMTGTRTPPDGLDMNYRGRPEGHGIVYERLSRSDSMSSHGSDSTDTMSMRMAMEGEEGHGAITTVRTFVEGLKEMAKRQGQNSGKIGKDIGLDVMEETSRNWCEEFERQQKEIMELWESCYVSLVHRTYFVLLFKGEEADSIYIGVELRRLLFLKHCFSHGNHAIHGGRTLTLSSSLKELQRERRMLSKLVGKRFSEEERKSLYEKFGIGMNSKRRRLQLINQLWSNPKDMKHVKESAMVIAKLVRFVEQGQAIKEMFGLSFTPSTRRSYSWRRSMATFF